MTGTRGHLVVLILLGAAAGCEPPAEAPTDQSVLAPKKFLGRTLSVFIDGRQTRPMEASIPPTWTVEPVSGNPTLRFLIDPEEFELPLRRVNITIHRVVEGRVDERVLYRPTARPSQPDQEVRLKSFERIGQNKYRKVAQLPPGQYRFSIHVIGQHSWDRQVIFLTVE